MAQNKELYRTYLSGKIFRDISACKTTEEVQNTVFKAERMTLSHQPDLTVPKNIILYNNSPTSPDDDTHIDVPIIMWPPRQKLECVAFVGYIMIGFVAEVNNTLTYVPVIDNTRPDTWPIVSKNSARYILYERIHPKIYERPGRKTLIRRIYTGLASIHADMLRHACMPPSDAADTNTAANEYTRECSKYIMALCSRTNDWGDDPSNTSTDAEEITAMLQRLYTNCTKYAQNTSAIIAECVTMRSLRENYITMWQGTENTELNTFVAQCTIKDTDDKTTITLDTLNKDCTTLLTLAASMYTRHNTESWKPTLIETGEMYGIHFTDPPSSILPGSTQHYQPNMHMQVLGQFVGLLGTTRDIADRMWRLLDCTRLYPIHCKFLSEVNINCTHNDMYYDASVKIPHHCQDADFNARVANIKTYVDEYARWPEAKRYVNAKYCGQIRPLVINHVNAMVVKLNHALENLKNKVEHIVELTAESTVSDILKTCKSVTTLKIQLKIYW